MEVKPKLCVGCRGEFQPSESYTSARCTELGLHLEPSYCYLCYRHIVVSRCRSVLDGWISFTGALCPEDDCGTRLSDAEVREVLSEAHARQYFHSLAGVEATERGRETPQRRARDERAQRRQERNEDRARRRQEKKGADLQKSQSASRRAQRAERRREREELLQAHCGQDGRRSERRLARWSRFSRHRVSHRIVGGSAGGLQLQQRRPALDRPLHVRTWRALERIHPRASIAELVRSLSQEEFMELARIMVVSLPLTTIHQMRTNGFVSVLSIYAYMPMLTMI